MAKTHRSEYQKSNRHRDLPLSDPGPVTRAAWRLLETGDAGLRQRLGADLLALIAPRTGVSVPDLVVPDVQQPHQRRGGRIVYSMQGEYTRRVPSREDPRVARGGKSLGRIRILNRTPARGDVVRGTAFLNTLLHEFCHHFDAEALRLERSFHTAGFYARIRHLRDQIAAGSAAPSPIILARRDRAESAISPAVVREAPQIRRRGTRRCAPPAAADFTPREMQSGLPPSLARLWAIIRDL
ncbi:MAG: hypothetical protein O7A63_06080 [Acidobacteria bacterium]|nr:hypothetical protein [Acidobacteriota bacterium]